MRHTKKRGFNLIEVATVLGVVGLVVGAIWVGAAALRENMAVKSIKEGIFITANNIQNMISINQSNIIGHNVNLVSMVLAAGGVPKDWVKSGTIQTPQGYDVDLKNYLGPERFDIKLSSVPKSLCIKLVVQVSTAAAQTSSGMGTGSGRSALGWVGAGSNSTMVFPIDLPTAESLCLADTQAVTFAFGYSRVN